VAPNDLAVLGASAAAACTDVRNGRIPNAIPAALCVIGAIVTAHEGIWGLLPFTGVLVFVLLAGTLAHASGLLGGGDVKLIAVACATLGIHDAQVFLPATFVAGGALALIFATSRGRLRTTFSNISTLAMPMLAGVRPPRLVHGTKMPYGVAIFAGALVAAFLHLA
jgi:Flp pilus assembly protein protease CpaA